MHGPRKMKEIRMCKAVIALDQGGAAGKLPLRERLLEKKEINFA